MPNDDTPGELACARLELPSHPEGAQPSHAELQLLEASISKTEAGALIVTMRGDPPAASYSLPLVAFLQFLGRFDEALTEALTKAPLPRT